MKISKRWTHQFLLLCSLVFALNPAYLSADHGADPKQTMEQLLEQIRAGRVNENSINRSREAEFIERKNQQQALLEQLEQQLATANQLSQQLEAEFNINEASLATQQQHLQERLGDLGELFGVVRQLSADTSAQLEQSMVSTQLPGRANSLAKIAKSRGLPTITDIEKLWFILTQEMHEQGRVVTFDAAVVNTQGIESNQPVTRIGPFVSFTQQGKFLRYLSATGQLSELPRQPRVIYQSAAEKLSNTTPEINLQSFMIAPVDPSSGAILSLLIQRPNISERIQQGGIIGYIVIFIGIIGILLGIERIISLSITFYRISQQAQKPQVISNNPLGRIFKAFDNAQRNPIEGSHLESLELKLDDLILKETPAIRRRLSTLKVLAGVAPLLGLLGTVTGMVETFDVITLFGSGDAKLMAGGISQALVTTALGLTVAIPILLLHSIASSRSRHIIECLEEQSAGLLAQYSQRNNTHA